MPDGSMDLNDSRLDELLAGGAEAWNRWRSENPPGVVSLAGKHFLHRDFSGFDFSGMELSATQFQNCVLVAARFDECWCEATAYSQELITGVGVDGGPGFAGSNLSAASFRSAQLQGASFYRTHAAEADFTGANLTGCAFVAANLTGAVFEGCVFRRAQFSRDSVLTNIVFGARHDPLADASDSVQLVRLFRWTRIFSWACRWASMRTIAGIRSLTTAYSLLIVALLWLHGVHAINSGVLEPVHAALAVLERAAEPPLPKPPTSADGLAEELDGQSRSSVARAEVPEVPARALTIPPIEEGRAAATQKLQRLRTRVPTVLPLPPQPGLTLVAFLLLAIGTSVFLAAAPESVRRYSETEWVYALNRPRLLYMRDSAGLGRWGYFVAVVQILALAASLVGWWLVAATFVGRLADGFAIVVFESDSGRGEWVLTRIWAALEAAHRSMLFWF